MIITPTTYADFKTLSGPLNATQVFFVTNASGVFQVGAIASDHGICVFLLLNTGEPPTFAADFPHAVALSSSGGWNVSG